MPLFSFYFNFDAELNNVNDMLTQWSGCKPSERAKQMGIPLEIAQTCLSDKISDELKAYFYSFYSQHKDELESALNFYQDFWAENEHLYKDKLEKIFEDAIPNYKCRLNLLLGGTSGWYERHLSINSFYYKKELASKPTHLLIILWELVLSLTFYKVRKIMSKEKLSDNQVWGIGELTAFCVIQKDIFDVDWNTGYKELEPLKEIFYSFYKDRINIDDYIDKGIKYFIKNPLTLGVNK